MTGGSSGPPGVPPDIPPGFQGDGRTPEWLRGKDEMGQTMVLVLRRKVDVVDDETTNRKQETRLPDPFIIGASVELAIGEKQARTVKASREGRGSRYLLRTNSRSIVEKLSKMTELTDGTKIEIFSHPTLNTVQGAVYEPDSINTDEKKIEASLKPQGVSAVRRIKKNVNGKLQNTPLLVITFHGSVLPRYVYFGLLRIEVRAYYPLPMICFNCGAYGHPRKFCKQSGICMRCSEPVHLAEGERCENPPHCYHCNNGHSVTSRDCPKYKEEDKIVHIKVNQSVSFAEARRMYSEENKRESIARIVQDQLKQELAAKDQVIANLQRQLDALTKQVTALRSALKARTHSQSPAPQPLSSQPISATHSSSSEQTQSATSTQKNNSRPSRKDKAFISPPTKWNNNRSNEKEHGADYDNRTRSRSRKHQMEISPTDTSNHRGKRPLTQPGTKSRTSSLDE